MNLPLEDAVVLASSADNVIAVFVPADAGHMRAVTPSRDLFRSLVNTRVVEYIHPAKVVAGCQQVAGVRAIHSIDISSLHGLLPNALNLGGVK